MARKSIKRHKEDMTRTELLKELRWNRGTMDKEFPKFCTFYGLEQSDFIDEDSGQYLFDKDWKSIIIVLLLAFHLHPLNRRINTAEDENNASQSSIIEYYEELMILIDRDLQDGIKYLVKNSPIYYRTVTEVEGIKRLTEKFTEVLTATTMVIESVRVHIWKELYDYLDSCVFRTYEVNEQAKLLYDEQKLENAQNKQERLKQLSIHKGAIEDKLYQQLIQDTLVATNLKDMAIEREWANENSIHSLDGLLVSILKRMMHPLKVDSVDIIHKKLQERRKLLEPLIESSKGMTYEGLYKERLKTLHEEIEKHVDKIRGEFETIKTVEDEVKEIIAGIEDGSFEGDEWEKEYYQGFLKFQAEAKKMMEQYRVYVSSFATMPATKSLKHTKSE